MESAGEWLEKALVELCSKIETGLGIGLDEEIIKGLVSYCDFAEPRDAKEYLDISKMNKKLKHGKRCRLTASGFCAYSDVVSKMY